MDLHTVAAVLIVKDEARHLSACLASVREWVDEIVVLDSGSSDSTIEIARKCGAKVYQSADWPGFGRQRQRAQSYVTSQWCLWLDADERVTPELRDDIIRVVKDNSGKNVYAFSRLNWFFGRFIRHCGWYPKPVVRLYPAKMTQYDCAEVHESVQIPKDVSVSVLRGDLLHYPYDDLRHYINKSSFYASEWALRREKTGGSSSVFIAFLHALWKFIRMYFLKRGFMDGSSGFLLCVLSSYYVFLKYASLWILRQRGQFGSDDA